MTNEESIAFIRWSFGLKSQCIALVSWAGLCRKFICSVQSRIKSLQPGRTAWCHPPKSKPELPLREIRLTLYKSLVPGDRTIEERYCFQICIFSLEFLPHRKAPYSVTCYLTIQISLWALNFWGSYSKTIPRIFLTVYDFNIILVIYFKVSIKSSSWPGPS